MTPEAASVARKVAKMIQLSDEKCPIHHINKMQIASGEPFCPSCQEDAIKDRKEQLTKDFSRERITGFLKRESLVSNKDVFDCTFDSFIAPKNSPEEKAKHTARVIAYEYMKYPQKPFNSVLYGKPGAGKTHLAMSILNAINEHADPPVKLMFVSVSKLFSKIKNSFDNPNELWTQDYAETKLLEPNVLVIDDLGSESVMSSDREASNFVQTILFNITESQKRIITTTNLSDAEIRRAYNPKLVSRLFANSRGHVIDFSKIRDKRI